MGWGVRFGGGGKGLHSWRKLNARKRRARVKVKGLCLGRRIKEVEVEKIMRKVI